MTLQAFLAHADLGTLRNVRSIAKTRLRPFFADPRAMKALRDEIERRERFLLGDAQDVDATSVHKFFFDGFFHA